METSDQMIADVLLDQSVFGGVGNRINNEVLWNTKVYPTTLANDLNAAIQAEIVQDAVRCATHWYQCEQSGEPLNSKAYQREECPRCGTAFEKAERGTRFRVTYWCPCLPG